ncbi:MAG: Hsp20 family protein [Alphaproteobacteria bacterium]|nr:Hsp20 family protein [Alphaproteobacteria bacterium]
MPRFDLTPIMRYTVGFDRLADMLDAAVDDAAPSYPPYNIEKLSEDGYRITMAVAGFAPEQIEVVQNGNVLTVAGKQKTEAAGAPERVYLHRGIAGRAFERRFELADHVNAIGSAIEHGLLHIELRREIPEALKPRRIDIASRVSKAA